MPTRKITSRMLHLSLATLLATITLMACGGGGGSSDSGSDVTLGNDSCDVLGLKIFNGSQCSPAGRSPVVDFIIHSLGGGISLCSGTIITPTRVLTAGHCFPNLGQDVQSIEVLADGARIPADGFAIHPGYREDSELVAIFNDVAVLSLSQSVRTAPLPLLVSRPTAAGDVIDIFGYGLDESGDVGTLQSGQMELSEVTETHLFSVFGSTGSNTCQGDSGGPAIESVSGTPGIVGITSTGSLHAECAVGDVSLFTNIQNASVLDFIKSNAPGVSVI
ncbi:MAG: trypsin-like serine protease [Bdellovibrionota bacterium]